MKPKASGQKLNQSESDQIGDQQSQPEQSKKEEVVELTEDEKALMNILKDNSPIALNELLGQSGLSN